MDQKINADVKVSLGRGVQRLSDLTGELLGSQSAPQRVDFAFATV